jgi:antitoxin VapB
MKTAKIFKNGSSQAVRLPKECRFESEEVYVQKYEGLVILCPKKCPWKIMLKSLDLFTEDYLQDRNQPKQDRPITFE